MIKTGKSPISIMTYLAIMSVCFIINLPGVAVAPIEGKLKALLHTSELEIQLLTVLPNFVIIPFVFLTGKLSDYKHKIPLIILALLIFVGSGIAYLTVNSMTGLIITSCFLGMADGILIPFAMGFIVNSFDGKYRTRNLGIKSAVSNFGTVIASFIVGILILHDNWHLPFIVYLSAVLPLLLCYWIKYIPGFGIIPIKPSSYQNINLKKDGDKDIDMPKITGLIFNNMSFTFITFSIIIYLPQLLQGFGKNPKLTSEITAVFFICVLSSGFFLEKFIKIFKNFTFIILGILVVSGLFFFCFIHGNWSLFVGSCLAGFAFGFFQPLIYDKTSYAVYNPKKNIFALSLVLTALYIAIALEPFIITGIVRLFKISDENYFAFILSLGLAIIYTVLAFLMRRRFTFSIDESYYS